MLFIAGIVAILVFTIQVYKTAVGTERNAPLWALLTAGVGIVFQFVVPFIIGIVLVVYYLATGTPPDQLEGTMFTGLATILNVACLILSIVGMVLVSKHVSKIREDVPANTGSMPPPPPPSFATDHSPQIRHDPPE